MNATAFLPFKSAICPDLERTPHARVYGAESIEAKGRADRRECIRRLTYDSKVIKGVMSPRKLHNMLYRLVLSQDVGISIVGSEVSVDGQARPFAPRVCARMTPRYRAPGVPDPHYIFGLLFV